MTPEEEAYEEALRPIREAEMTGALELDITERHPWNRKPRKPGVDRQARDLGLAKNQEIVISLPEQNWVSGTCCGGTQTN
jgi:hypothetical protein